MYTLHIYVYTCICVFYIFFPESEAEATANIDAMSKALDALEKGMAGSFLQTDAAQTLRNLVKNKEDLFGDDDKDLFFCGFKYL